MVRKLKTEKATEIEVKHILFINYLFSRYIELRLSIYSFLNVCLNVMNSKSKNLTAQMCTCNFTTSLGITHTLTELSASEMKHVDCGLCNVYATLY